MRFHARFSLPALLVGATVAISAPAAQAAFGVESWFAGNCKVNTCKKVPPAEEKEKAELEAYTQAAGHPPFGITEFKLKRHVIQTVPFETLAPEGNLKNLRIDVAPGVSTNPEAVEKCSVKEFTSTEVEPVKHLFLAPKCGAGSIIGENKVTTVLEPAPKVFADVPLTGTVYNLEQPEGLSSYFGVALEIPGKGVFVHTFIKGNVEWASDYHDYFVIEGITPGLLESRLIFKGNIGEIGKGAFLANPSNCAGPGPQTTTGWRGEPYPGEGSTATASFTTPVGAEGCNGAAPFSPVPFAPGFSLEPGAGETASDQPDGITTELTLPHDPEPSHIDSSQLKTASITLPEGMTLNESAAHGLEACTPAQARIHSPIQGVSCPPGSKIGTLTFNVPGLPPGPGSFEEGNIYLGGPESGPITAPPYTIYLDAESKRYGVSVRVQGSVVPNETTGRLTTTFSENPEQPFSNLVLHFNGGALATLANPLLCGTASTETVFTPFTGTAPTSPFVKPFAVDSDGKGGACASSPPFSLTQTTENQSANAGGHTSSTLNLVRASGQQFLSHLKTTLPAGLVGAIPAVTQCGEPQANAGTCPMSSQIGTVNVEAGAGPAPFSFSGPIYLTGPYNGAPFGVSIAVAAVAGPFNLGTVVTRGTINVDPFTARVTVEATMPRIVKGVGLPSSGVLLRLRKVSAAVNKQGFLLNPTNCGALATESTLTGFILPQSAATATQTLSTPFQVGECGKLAFKPSFKASTFGKTSKANGASLETTINQPAGQANIKSVSVQLPIQLPSRLTTLQKACPEATFAANPLNCPAGSRVGGVRANTPVLPAKMTGPAYLVSHAAAAFPDLDLVLEGNGVRVILVGNTDIKKGITRTTFATSPDVPVSSVTVNLPIGPHSALAANGNLCASSLLMPTTMEGQNGKTIKQNTKISVTGCGVRIVGHKVIGRTAFLTVRTFAAGRISGSGAHLATVYRHLNGARNATTLKVPLSRGAGRHVRTRVRVGFLPRKRGAPSSAAFVTVSFR
jgi:hypothetical protein